MSSLRIINRLTVILLLAAALLGFLVFSLWQDLRTGRHSQQAAGSTQTSPRTARTGVYQQGLISFTPPPVNVFNEILERPLFTDGRLPPEEPLQTNDAQPMVQLRLRLEGVATSGDKRIALVRDLSNNQLMRLHQGMKHQGWTVNEVKSESAEFKRGDETTELLLDIQKGAKAAIPVSRIPGSSSVRSKPSRRTRNF